MYELTIKTDFAAAHNLRGYDGACERLHGHNWQVEVEVRAEKLDELDMAVDFKVIKGATAEVMDKLDHHYLNEVPPFDKLNPSAENIAKYIFDEVGERINDGNVIVHLVRVWESEKAAAAYYE